MQISRITSMNAQQKNTQPNFNGVFNIVRTSEAGDNYEKCEITYTHAIYHPYKKETNAQITKAMRDFRKQSKNVIETRQDGGIDRKTGKPMTHKWNIIEKYTCELGDRLSDYGEGIIVEG